MGKFERFKGTIRQIDQPINRLVNTSLFLFTKQVQKDPIKSDCFNLFLTLEVKNCRRFCHFQWHLKTAVEQTWVEFQFFKDI